MNCLVCHMETHQETVEGVEIDLCVNCGGVWLDGGELEALTGHDLKNYRQLLCPECNLIMLTRTIGTVEVDHCFKCGGTWLDKGELQGISEMQKEGVDVKEDFNKFSSGVERTRNIEIAKKSMNKHVELKDGMIDEVFVMYKDGLLITCSTKKADQQDDGVNEDILAGTLMTIQDFIEVSFGKMGASGLKEIKFGDREILIERGDNIITAVVASGDIPDNFNEYVQEVIGKIEDRYQAPLTDWDGNLSDLVGVQQMLTNLLGEGKTKNSEAGAAPVTAAQAAPLTGNETPAATGTENEAPPAQNPQEPAQETPKTEDPPEENVSDAPVEEEPEPEGQPQENSEPESQAQDATEPAANAQETEQPPEQ